MKSPEESPIEKLRRLLGTCGNTTPSMAQLSGAAGLPASHDGTAAFTVRLSLSQDIASGNKSKLWRALSRSGANMKWILRVNNRLDLFEVTLEPKGDDDVILSLGPSPTDCTADDAVCTSDGTTLTGGATATIAGPSDTS